MVWCLYWKERDRIFLSLNVLETSWLQKFDCLITDGGACIGRRETFISLNVVEFDGLMRGRVAHGPGNVSRCEIASVRHLAPLFKGKESIFHASGAMETVCLFH